MKQPKKNISMSGDAIRSRLRSMFEEKERISKNISDYHVQISPGNTKTGNTVASVSLIPIAYCPNSKECKSQCYDIRNDCRHNGVKNARARNTAIWEIEPQRYFNEVSWSVKFVKYFRWHIGGDIVNMEYLKGMVRVAEENQHCTFLAFTKNYSVVNDYLSKCDIPENLKIIFSRWPGLPCENPFSLPEAHILFADGVTTADERTKPCGGNCSECAVTDSGCWTLKSGESVSFPAH